MSRQPLHIFYTAKQILNLLNVAKYNKFFTSKSIYIIFKCVAVIILGLSNKNCKTLVFSAFCNFQMVSIKTLARVSNKIYGYSRKKLLQFYNYSCESLLLLHNYNRKRTLLLYSYGRKRILLLYNYNRKRILLLYSYGRKRILLLYNYSHQRILLLYSYGRKRIFLCYS